MPDFSLLPLRGKEANRSPLGFTAALAYFGGTVQPENLCT
jgi:hypothetical protein